MQQVRWAEFELQELFEVKTSKSVDKGNIILSDEEKPFHFIGRTSVNYGVQGFVEKLGFEPNPKNTFSIIQIGENISQFRTREWYASQNIFILSPLTDRIIKSYNFFVSSINSALKVYDGGYTNYPTLEKLKNQKIFLPVKPNSDLDKLAQIDFDFMENFIAELNAQRLAELNVYLSVTGLKDYTLTIEEQQALKKIEQEEIIWAEFELQKLFDKLDLRFKKTKFDKEKDISRERTEEFDLPLVNAKNGDNGIMYYGRGCDFDSAEMTIDIVGDGAVSTGNVYPQPQRTGVLYNAYLVKPRFNANKQLLYFLASAIQKSIKLKYGYENKAGWAKVKNEKISLPIKPDANLDIISQIDFDFMETFISAVQKLVIKNVVLYADREIAVTEQIIQR